VAVLKGGVGLKIPKLKNNIPILINYPNYYICIYLTIINMKNRILFFIVVFTIMLGCSKDGEQGPKGDKGDKGEQGDMGAKGADGTKVLSGTTAPVANLGNLGDYYIDLALTNIYGPKTANSWGNPTSLRIARGEWGKWKRRIEFVKWKCSSNHEHWKSGGPIF